LFYLIKSISTKVCYICYWRWNKLPIDITKGVPKDPYQNAQGKTIEITHVEVTYYEFKKDDRKRFITLPTNEANEFANRKGINGAFISQWYDKEEAKQKGLIK
jgi:hypothetical protein